MRRSVAGKYGLNVSRGSNKNRAFAEHRRKEMSRYTVCNRMMKGFLKSPSKKSWKKFNDAFRSYEKENPTQASILMIHAKKEIFDRGVRIEDFR